MVWEEADLFQDPGGDLGNQYADKRRLWDDNLMLRMATRGDRDSKLQIELGFLGMRRQSTVQFTSMNPKNRTRCVIIRT